MYAHIAFPIADYKQFVYSIPKDLSANIQEGTCIQASFKNKLEFGFVVGTSNYTSYKNQIKPISNIVEDKFQIPFELWQTIKWISKYYICPLGVVLKSSIPLIFNNTYKPKQTIFCKITNMGKQSMGDIKKKAPMQFNFLKLLLNSADYTSLSTLSKKIPSGNQIYKKLYQKNLISILLKEDINNQTNKIIRKKIELNKEQKHVFHEIKQSINQPTFDSYLLHGVTSSGKTEIYIKLANEIIKCKKTVIILVPEISLTPQLSKKFIDTFGNKVALWHSKLTKQEKYQTWQNLNQNKYSIIIGARSAIFSPINNLGLIIIDEEHDASYKQDISSFKYHARDVAMIRAKYSNSTILLGSATPSIESYYYAINKKLKLLTITSRYNNAKYPLVDIIDMKQGANRFSYDFSHKLINEMKRCIANNEQMILLHNRRGFSTVCQCHNCGDVITCANCSISLTYHSNTNLICHYCSSNYPKPNQCRKCNSPNINFIGSGTQKIEFEISKLFPDAKIARMDFDTMKKYKSYNKTLEDFSNYKYDILLGTQMIAKGLDFKKVTLVGVINGDTSLYIPDFRSGERTFQLLYQVCGRAGRHNKSSKAIIQSWNSENQFITAAANLNLDYYYKNSLADRKKLNYPPFSKLIRIMISGKEKKLIESKATIIKKKLEKDARNFIILGPSIAPIEKINNNWRYHLLIKVKKKYFNNTYQHIEKKLGFTIFNKLIKGTKTEIEVDPISIL